MFEKVRAALARRRAVGKSEFVFKDYPVRVRRNGRNGMDAALGQEYVAQIINWWVLVGIGPTPQAARDDLKRSFDEAVADGMSVPRPGEEVPITFAEHSQIQASGNLPIELIQELFGITAMFISDSSSLDDFASGEDVEKAIKKIAIIYGVDVSDFEDHNIAQICARITNR